MSKQQYEKININLEEFKIDASSGNFTPKELAIKYNLLRDNKARRVYYIANKHNIPLNFKKDKSYITDEYREKISRTNTGRKRTDEQILNYKAAAAKRGNNRPIGSYNHSEDTKNKIRESNLKTYENLPPKWLSSCADKPEWFAKLRKIDYNRLNEWEKYQYDVRSLSHRNARKYKKLIKGTKNEGHHLDHILSISEAFNNNIEVEIVSSYHNLRYIPAKQNLQKNSSSEITIEELKQKYYTDQS